MWDIYVGVIQVNISSVLRISSVVIALSLIGCNGGSSTTPTTPSPQPTVTNSPTPSPTTSSSPTPIPTATPTPTFCEQNVANFSSISGRNLLAAPFDYTWGPSLAELPFPDDLMQCRSSVTWNQERVVAAISYWVSQKVNYCHHHVPTWDPAYMLDGITANPQADAAFAACSTVADIMPPIPVDSHIRWNYSGVGVESATAWHNVNSGLPYATGKYGYGLDCSDYTKLIYAYAESMYFSSDTSKQAGQSPNQSKLAPNMPGFVDAAESDTIGLHSAGNLVCADGTLAPDRGIANSSSCDGHGGYISVFESNGTYNANAVTDTILDNLQPGDLIYIAGLAYDEGTQKIDPTVTHVVIWTGQKIGSSTFVSESMIAPRTEIDSWGYHHGECNTDSWSAANNIGNWIISDSHYQGPDFRAFTSCFYRNQVWGVRRVLRN